MVRLFLLLSLLPLTTLADPPRARPPEFTEEDRAPFYDDAFQTLVGERPVPAAAGTVTTKLPGSVSPAAAPSAASWVELIDPDTLETEIKRQTSQLAKATRSATTFKSGGYREAVDALGLAASLFAVTAEHKGSPRWRDTAGGLRDLLAESATAADDASDDGHAVAAARSADLTDLVRGGRPDTPEPNDAFDWAEVAERTMVMRRMSEAEEERLRGWVATDRAFRRNSEEVRHEAQVLAALAEAIVLPESFDYDDPDYRAFARRLRDAATELSAAAEAEDREAATRAMTEVSRSCVDCHADYRG